MKRLTLLFILLTLTISCLSACTQYVPLAPGPVITKDHADPKFTIKSNVKMG